MESTLASTQHGPFDSTFGSYSLFETHAEAQAHVHASCASFWQIKSVFSYAANVPKICVLLREGLRTKVQKLDSYLFLSNSRTNFP